MLPADMPPPVLVVLVPNVVLPVIPYAEAPLASLLAGLPKFACIVVLGRPAAACVAVVFRSSDGGLVPESSVSNCLYSQLCLLSLYQPLLSRYWWWNLHLHLLALLLLWVSC